MNNKKKALLLASIASLSILCGCGSPSTKRVKSIETEDGTYIESNGEYVRLDISPKVFEPGTHIIQYVHKVNDGSSYHNSQLTEGYNNSLFSPDVPEGYKIIGTTGYSNNYGYDNYMVYIMVNEETVEVEGRYDINTNSVMYNIPGKVVKEKTLGLGD